jgi:hypothetical protein
MLQEAQPTPSVNPGAPPPLWASAWEWGKLRCLKLCAHGTQLLGCHSLPGTLSDLPRVTSPLRLTGTSLGAGEKSPGWPRILDKPLEVGLPHTCLPAESPTLQMRDGLGGA